MELSKSISRHSWSDARTTFSSVNKELAQIIDRLDVNDDFYLYTVQYPYGALIVDHGEFQVPNENDEMVSILDDSLPKSLQFDLSYCGTIPLGLVVENKIEAFMTGKDRIIPSSTVGEGRLISLWRVLEEEKSYHTGKFWCISSGSRSICMVPKITNSASHHALMQHYHITQSIPARLFDHWELFTSLANSTEFTSPWKSSLIFFSRSWIEKTRGDPAWNEFYLYLFKTVWKSSAYRRNQFIFNFAFSLAQDYRNLRPNPYLADTVQHLVAISEGDVPAFTPAIDDSTAPITGIQNAYIDVYGLKKYDPVILHGENFLLDSDKVAYYSFQIPTTMFFSPKSRRSSSIMQDMQEVKYIMNVLISEILQGNLEIENTPLYDLAERIEFNYFHTDNSTAGDINPSSAILQLNPKFCTDLNISNEQLFAEYSPFFKGCISISKKQK